MATEVIASDPIAPVSITHSCEEIVTDGQVEQFYNYLDYWFEREGARIRARVYMDECGKALLYPALGPMTRNEGPAIVPAPTLRRDVIAFLKRRFHRIEELGPSGYAPIAE